MKIWKYSGIFLVITGILHTIVALLLGGNSFITMLKNGLVNSINEDVTRGLAFWFLFCGIIVIILGHILHFYIKKEQKPAPLFLGYYLLTVSILVCLVEPASGGWLFIPQALIIIFANRKGNLS